MEELKYEGQYENCREQHFNIIKWGKTPKIILKIRWACEELLRKNIKKIPSILFLKSVENGYKVHGYLTIKKVDICFILLRN